MGLQPLSIGRILRPPKREPNFRAQALLRSPGIPAPLYGMAPRVLMPGEWWRRVRQEALAGNNYCCWACGEDPEYHPLGSQNMEAHEHYTIDYEGGVMEYLQTTALCVPCHRFVHLGRTGYLASKGEISQEEYRRVEEWGYLVLGEAKESPTELIVPWEKWKLRIGEMEFLSPGPTGRMGADGE